MHPSSAAPTTTVDLAPRAATVPVHPLARLREARQGLRTRHGVLAAVALVALLAGLVVIAVQPFASADESAHADYGLTIFTQWRLPTLFDHVRPVFPYQVAKPQHVANHPPLYYLLTGPLLTLGVRTGHLVGAYLVARGVSVLAAMVTVLFIAAFAHELTRGRRPAVTVGSAVLAATYAPFVTVSGVLQNDALATAFSAASLWLILLIIRRGPSLRMTAWLALVTFLGTAVRADNASLVLVGCLAALAAAGLHAPAGTGWRAVRTQGLTAALAVGLTSVVGIGWFYLRSQRLYGNPLGSGFLAKAFGHTARPQSWWMLRHPTVWLEQLGLPQPALMMTAGGLLTALPAAAALAGLALLLPRAVRSWQHAGWAASDAVREQAVLVLLFGIHTLVTLATIVQMVDGGGGIHTRYLLPLLPLVTTAGARALVALPGGRRGLWIGAAAVAGLVVTVEQIGLAAWRWVPNGSGPTFRGIRNGVGLIGIPHPTAVVLAVLALAVAAVGTAVLSARWPRAAAEPAASAAT